VKPINYKYIVCRSDEPRRYPGQKLKHIIIAEVDNFFKAWIIATRVKHVKNCWSIVLKKILPPKNL